MMHPCIFQQLPSWDSQTPYPRISSQAQSAPTFSFQFKLCGRWLQRSLTRGNYWLLLLLLLHPGTMKTRRLQSTRPSDEGLCFSLLSAMASRYLGTFRSATECTHPSAVPRSHLSRTRLRSVLRCYSQQKQPNKPRFWGWKHWPQYTRDKLLTRFHSQPPNLEAYLSIVACAPLQWGIFDSRRQDLLGDTARVTRRLSFTII